jgi:hypothetical protein
VQTQGDATHHPSAGCDVMTTSALVIAGALPHAGKGCTQGMPERRPGPGDHRLLVSRP